MPGDITRFLGGPIDGKCLSILLLGPPGAGKTTLGHQLSSLLKLQMLSVSGLLREMAEQSSSSTIRKSIIQSMQNGSQVELSELNEAVLAWINSNSNKNQIVDGFPRTEKAKLFFEKSERCIGGRFFIIFHVFSDVVTCKKRFISKSHFRDSERVFNERMAHYSTVERFLIRDLGQNFPLLNFET